MPAARAPVGAPSSRGAACASATRGGPAGCAAGGWSRGPRGGARGTALRGPLLPVRSAGPTWRRQLPLVGAVRGQIPCCRCCCCWRRSPCRHQWSGRHQLRAPTEGLGCWGTSPWPAVCAAVANLELRVPSAVVAAEALPPALLRGPPSPLRARAPSDRAALGLQGPSRGARPGAPPARRAPRRLPRARPAAPETWCCRPPPGAHAPGPHASSWPLRAMCCSVRRALGQAPPCGTPTERPPGARRRLAPARRPSRSPPSRPPA
mmetsp:Transcript_103905/g.320486  ORF Transcript_103905/g.320486 Transcript_103905/m.320486 type:complete len:263 (-) Transcript_103905:74-862(-)